MTDQEINLAIAEACGWEATKAVNPISGETVILWFSKGRRVITNDGLPNYCSDLNAMHEAEESLDEGQQDTFIIYLKRLVDAGLDDFQHEFNAIHAAARQRAEAFLRVLGKWPSTTSRPRLTDTLKNNRLTTRPRSSISAAW